MYNLTNDYLFKLVFSQKNILRNFLKETFHLEIGDFDYRNKEFLKVNKNFTFGISDILIETENEIIILEMQNKNYKNIEPRIMMYISKLYAENWKDKNYQNIKPVKVCLILNYKQGKRKVLKEYIEFERSLNERFGNLLNIKVWNLVEARKNKQNDNEYCTLFSNINEKILSRVHDKKLLEIVKLIKKYNMNYEDYRRMEEIEMLYDIGFTNMIDDAFHGYKEEGIKIGRHDGIKIGRQDGIKIGRQDGIKIGRQDGIKIGRQDGIRDGEIKKQNQIVQNMFKEGFTIEQIEKAVNMKKEDILKLIPKET